MLTLALTLIQTPSRPRVTIVMINIGFWLGKDLVRKGMKEDEWRRLGEAVVPLRKHGIRVVWKTTIFATGRKVPTETLTLTRTRTRTLTLTLSLCQACGEAGAVHSAAFVEASTEGDQLPSFLTLTLTPNP